MNNTPKLDSMENDSLSSDHWYRTATKLHKAGSKLNYENAVLRAALSAINDLTPAIYSKGDYLAGEDDALKACQEIARGALKFVGKDKP